MKSKSLKCEKYALWSLICAITSVTIFLSPLSVVGVVFAILAQKSNTENNKKVNKQAKAGMIIGSFIMGVVIWSMMLALFDICGADVNEGGMWILLALIPPIIAVAVGMFFFIKINDVNRAKHILNNIANEYIEDVNHQQHGSWQQYDVLLTAIGFGWGDILSCADYMTKNDLAGISEVTVSEMPGAAVNVTDAYRKAGEIVKTQELLHEQSMLSVAGISQILNAPVKIAWMNQTRTFRVFTLCTDKQLVNTYIQFIVREGLKMKNNSNQQITKEKCPDVGLKRKKDKPGAGCETAIFKPLRTKKQRNVNIIVFSIMMALLLLCVAGIFNKLNEGDSITENIILIPIYFLIAVINLIPLIKPLSKKLYLPNRIIWDVLIILALAAFLIAIEAGWLIKNDSFEDLLFIVVVSILLDAMIFGGYFWLFGRQIWLHFVLYSYALASKKSNTELLEKKAKQVIKRLNKLDRIWYIEVKTDCSKYLRGVDDDTIDIFDMEESARINCRSVRKEKPNCKCTVLSSKDVSGFFCDMKHDCGYTNAQYVTSFGTFEFSLPEDAEPEDAEPVKLVDNTIQINSKLFSTWQKRHFGPQQYEQNGTILLKEKTPVISLYEDGVKTQDYCLQTENDEDFTGKYFHISVRLAMMGRQVPVAQIDGFVSDTAEECNMASSDIGYRFEGRFLTFYGNVAKQLYEATYGQDLEMKGLKYTGYTTPTNVRLVGICPQCGKSFAFHGYAFYMIQNDVAYSDDGMDVCEISQVIDDKDSWTYETDGKIFRYYNSFNCPHCGTPYIDYRKYPKNKVFGVSGCTHLGRKPYSEK